MELCKVSKEQVSVGAFHRQRTTLQVKIMLFTSIYDLFVSHTCTLQSSCFDLNNHKTHPVQRQPWLAHHTQHYMKKYFIYTSSSFVHVCLTHTYSYCRCDVHRDELSNPHFIYLTSRKRSLTRNNTTTMVLLVTVTITGSVYWYHW